MGDFFKGKSTFMIAVFKEGQSSTFDCLSKVLIKVFSDRDFHLELRGLKNLSQC